MQTSKLNLQPITSFKCLPFLFMLSVVFLIISMTFTYRILQFGHFLAPGGIFVFVLTYFIADIVSEVYGYRTAKTLIWGNFFCIFVFNFSCYLLMKLPTLNSEIYEPAYSLVFGHGLIIMLGFSLSFLISDFINAYTISRWKVLLKGKYFWLRSIGASIIAAVIFTIIASGTLYTSVLDFGELVSEFLTALIFKIVLSIILSYPGVVIVAILKRIDNIDVYDYRCNYNPVAFGKDHWVEPRFY